MTYPEMKAHMERMVSNGYVKISDTQKQGQHVIVLRHPTQHGDHVISGSYVAYPVLKKRQFHLAHA
jgi:O-glycosyl hydrolase